MCHVNLRSLGTAALVFLLVSSAAKAGTVLTLSDLSSDETPSWVLDASLTFDVLDDSLTVLVANDTGPEAPFNISEVYFNAVGVETDIALSVPVSGWTLLRDQRADGFGTFDFALIGDPGSDPARVGAGESALFTFDILGVDVVVASDFTTDLSTIPPGEHPVVAAIKFVNGPGDDSAYGAVIPEPMTVILLLAGCWLAVVTTRRSVGRQTA